MIAIKNEYVPRAPASKTRMTQFLPFLIFYILICDPADLSVGPVSLSLAIFPLVLLGYRRAALTALGELLPGVQKIVLTLFAIVIVFCLWGLCTAIGSPEFLRTFRPLYGHASGLAIVISVLALSRSSEDAKKLKFFCLVAILLCLALTYFLGPRGYHDRYPGTFKHPNQLGIVALTVALYVSALAVSTVGRPRLWAIAGSCVAILAMILSGSKTNILLFGVLSPVMVVLVALQRHDVKARVSDLIRNLLFILLVIFAGIVALANLNERAFSVLDSTATGGQDLESYHSVDDRNGIWRESWAMLEKQPFTGVGAGQPLSDGTEHSHNVFMDTARTMGVPGLALITTFIVIVLWYVVASFRSMKILRRFSNSRIASESFRGPMIGSLMAVTGYIVANQMSDSFGPSTLPFFYLFFAFSLTYFLPEKGIS